METGRQLWDTYTSQSFTTPGKCLQKYVKISDTSQKGNGNYKYVFTLHTKRLMLSPSYG